MGCSVAELPEGRRDGHGDMVRGLDLKFQGYGFNGLKFERVSCKAVCALFWHSVAHLSKNEKTRLSVAQAGENNA